MDKSNNVNHPLHYADSTSIECIEAQRLILGDVGVSYACFFNIVKYCWRFKNKNGLEDINKAKWYYDYAHKLIYGLPVATNNRSNLIEILGRCENLIADTVAKLPSSTK